MAGAGRTFTLMKVINRRTLLILLLMLLSFSVIYHKRIQFEYYVWNLSSEDPDKRDANAAKIISMGYEAVPWLIDKLDRHYIFETEYEVFCLERITRTNTYDPKTVNFYEVALPFWKKWWNENQNRINAK